MSAETGAISEPARWIWRLDARYEARSVETGIVVVVAVVVVVVVGAAVVVVVVLVVVGAAVVVVVVVIDGTVVDTAVVVGAMVVVSALPSLLHAAITATTATSQILLELDVRLM